MHNHEHGHSHDGEHSHQHMHGHTHEHTHDGVAHTHEHVHEHTHSHEHPHCHDHLHDDGSAHNHTHSPAEELMALIKYMVTHNAAHAKELAELAQRLDALGNHKAYEKVMSAVADFEQGNGKLSAVLSELKGE